MVNGLKSGRRSFVGVPELEIGDNSDFAELNFCQVKARTPSKQLKRRSKGALKDQSRLIQHFTTKELQTANFRSKHHGILSCVAAFFRENGRKQPKCTLCLGRQAQMYNAVGRTLSAKKTGRNRLIWRKKAESAQLTQGGRKPTTTRLLSHLLYRPGTF